MFYLENEDGLLHRFSHSNEMLNNGNQPSLTPLKGSEDNNTPFISYFSDVIQGYLISRLTDLCAGGDIETLGTESMTNVLFLGLGCTVSVVLQWATVQGVGKKVAWLLRRIGGETTDLDLSLNS